MLERINQAIRHRGNDENGEAVENSEEGFTLVELLIVVVVLGILAAVTVFGLSGTTSQSHAAACNADVRSVEVAVEAYHANNSPNWPLDIPTLTQNDVNNNNVVYLRTKPTDTHYKVQLDPAQNGRVQVDNLQGGGFQDYDTNLNKTPPVNLCSAVK